VLTLRDVTVGAGGKRLLVGLSIELEPGRAISLLGPSGCGKTTLLRGVACLDDLVSGELTLGSQAPSDIGEPAWRRRVTYVAQRPVLFDGSLLDNLERPFTYRSATRCFDRERAEELLASFDLEGARDQSASTLSEGQRQRACLVRALLLQPEVLLLDEPTSALDERRRDAVEATLRGQLEHGVSMLVVTHDAMLSDRLGADSIDLAEFLSAETQGVAHG